MPQAKFGIVSSSKPWQDGIIQRRCQADAKHCIGIFCNGVGLVKCEGIYVAASCRMEKHPPNRVSGNK
eukprot:11602123-Ditylum_brightwellii.AAC.1